MVNLPSAELSRIQNEWLAEARARILRNAQIAERKAILDLGTGYGVVCPELLRRGGGPVFALDLSLEALRSIQGSHRVCGNAVALPFPAGRFDLVFSQNFLLWATPLSVIFSEVKRMLSAGGVWVLLEPDYGGMMEYPEEIRTKDLWIQVLERAGADPMIGRKLPVLLQEHGFHVRVELLPRIQPPHHERFHLLNEMGLTSEESEKLSKIMHASGNLRNLQIVHLPYFLIIAESARNC